MDFLFDLAGPIALVLVFAIAMAEGGLLIGLFLPGEAPLIIAGVLAYQGRVALPAVLLAAASGAVLGDSVGYWLGRRYGSKLETTRVGRKIGRPLGEIPRLRARTRGQGRIPRPFRQHLSHSRATGGGIGAHAL